ncbi:hypothetical protein HK097_007348 [Rhizophlyctis rosea]|uniref:Uncharacterized protein n=1 Tax=Rhizophlyctis rosea TaxID=64517 RepID=A0AAD5X595_9FUNG|nr:hypothetical protein HK097_007348 [Rhizophlyctis rosea]
MPHVLFSRHVLGADDHRLDEEWDDEKSYLEKKKYKEGVKVDASNWKSFIGKKEYYGNVLEYFDGLLATATPTEIPTIITNHIFPHLLPNLVAGAVHPLIHLGFGIEFQNREVIAEALTEACLHDPSTAPILAHDNSKAIKGKTILQIYDDIRNDRRFDDVVKFSDGNKTNSVLKNGSEIVRSYAGQFWVDDDPQNLLKTLQNIFLTSSHLAFQTGLHPPHAPKLDFFLMHLLTSSLSLRQIIPYLTISRPSDLFPSSLCQTLMTLRVCSH